MKKLLSIILVAILSVSGFAQTLDDQFNELRDNSETFKVYKVIKQAELNQFWNVVSDSVRVLKQTIEQSQKEINLQGSKIIEQENIIKAKDDEMASLLYDTGHISVLGIDLFKEAYIAISFSTIGVLVIVLILFFTRFKSNQNIVKRKVADWKKISAELEEFKKESLEKQMKLRRELQTQLNKLNEIRSA
ncbi:MAG: hypothetical protein AAF731_09905 [Bacteroidota bacterium]